MDLFLFHSWQRVTWPGFSLSGCLSLNKLYYQVFKLVIKGVAEMLSIPPSPSPFIPSAQKTSNEIHRRWSVRVFLSVWIWVGGKTVAIRHVTVIGIKVDRRGGRWRELLDRNGALWVTRTRVSLHWGSGSVCPLVRRGGGSKPRGLSWFVA